MGKIIICWKFEKMPLGKRNEFRRKLFGTIEKTHEGKYKNETKGYLSNKHYEKPIRSVLIVDKKYLKEIQNILNEFKATIWIYHIKESE